MTNIFNLDQEKEAHLLDLVRLVRLFALLQDSRAKRSTEIYLLPALQDFNEGCASDPSASVAFTRSQNTEQKRSNKGFKGFSDRVSSLRLRTPKKDAEEQG